MFAREREAGVQELQRGDERGRLFVEVQRRVLRGLVEILFGLNRRGLRERIIGETKQETKT